MSEDINALKDWLRKHLDESPAFIHLPSPDDTSEETKLRAYRTTSGKTIGIEFRDNARKENARVLSFWTHEEEAPSPLPDGVRTSVRKWNPQTKKYGSVSALNRSGLFSPRNVIRFSFTNKRDVIDLLDHLLRIQSQRRYLVKINGELHCPRAIASPEHASDWDGGEIITKSNVPVQLTPSGNKTAPPIQEGDELWIWTHEDKKFGGGRGLTAKAIAGAQRQVGGDIAITLQDVELLEAPLGFEDLGKDPTGSRLIDYMNGYRHRRVYLIDDDLYEDFKQVVDERSDMQRESGIDWDSEVENHANDLENALRTRKKSTSKSRAGQSKFREALIARYDGKCALSGCDVEPTLHAAHVLPHTGDTKWDCVDNGLLLRMDLHSLFDEMLWSIDPESNTIVISASLAGTHYDSLEGQTVVHSVAPAILKKHFEQFQKGKRA